MDDNTIVFVLVTGAEPWGSPVGAKTGLNKMFMGMLTEEVVFL